MPNTSTVNMTMSNSSSYYNLTYTNLQAGRYNATIYANDTSGYINNSSTLHWNVTGFANISLISPVNGEHRVYQNLRIACRVIDANNSLPVANYPVRFWNKTTLIGVNYTNTSGYAEFNWNVTGTGTTVINCSITTNATLLYNATTYYDNTTIRIAVPNVTLEELEHENNFTRFINEYETYDNIGWVNVTANNTGLSTAQNITITLNIVEPSGQIAQWFKTETKQCFQLNSNQSCEAEFNNESSGYNITTTTAGTYKFNVTISWFHGGMPPNRNLIEFTIHHVPDNFTGYLNDSEITPEISTIYIFNITNPWSKNLTKVNVTINCPNITGMSCNCSTTSKQYCEIGNVQPYATETAVFNITTTQDTPFGEYPINVTVSYTNPGNENHSWEEYENDILRIMPLVAYIIDYPTNITRGSGLANLTSYAKNIGTTDLDNVTLNWTLPHNWTNTTGSLKKFASRLVPEEKLWNNITIITTINATLGNQPIIVTANSPNATEDSDTKYVMVTANSFVYDITFNNTEPFRGETISITARLIYDNGTAVFNQSLIFQGSTTSTTNATGYATASYVVPQSATLGILNFSINVSHPGNYTISFTNPSSNTTNITVKDKVIIKTTRNPITTGYGQNITIIANITSGIAIDTATANITLPDGSVKKINLTSIGDEQFIGVFSYTWQKGQYNFTVWANNTGGTSNTSSKDYFFIKANATININVTNALYGPNRVVNLSGVAGAEWWNSTWNYRIPVSINSTDYNRTDIVVVLSINFTDVLTNELGIIGQTFDNNSIRIIEVTSLRGMVKPYNESQDYFFVEVKNKSHYNASTNAYVELIWILNGTTMADSSRYYYVYFDTLENGPKNATGFKTGLRLHKGIAYVANQQDYAGSYDAVQSIVTEYEKTESFFDSTVVNLEPDNYSMVIFGEDSLDTTEQTIVGLNNSFRNKLEDYVARGGIVISQWVTGTPDQFLPGISVTDNAGETIVEPIETHELTTTPNDVRNFEFYGDEGIYSSTTYTLVDTIEDSSSTTILRIIKHKAGYVFMEDFGYATSNSTLWEAIYENYLWYLINHTNNDMDITRGDAESYSKNSKLTNVGSTNLSGYFIMKVQTNNSGEWTDISQVVVNDTNTKKQRTINSSNEITLHNIWNGPGEGSGWNTDSYDYGYYRAVVMLTGPNGTILKNENNSNISGFSIFYLDTLQPNITLISPNDNYHTKNLNITFVYIPYENYGVESCNFVLNNKINMTDSNVSVSQQNNFSIVNMSEGLHEWYINCTDKAGNVNKSEVRTIVIDLTGPSIQLLTPPDYNTSNTTVMLNWTIIDYADTNFTCNVTIDGLVNVTNITVFNNTPANVTISGLDEGVHVWNISCWDTLNNSNTSETRNLTIIRGPANVTAKMDSDRNSVIINWSPLWYADSYNIYQL